MKCNHAKDYITLIGMPGVGKSYWGEKLAKYHKALFVDVDHIIESRYNKKLHSLVNHYKEDSFIKLESLQIKQLKFHAFNKKEGLKKVISTGGSAILSRQAMLFLVQNTTVIYLKDTLLNIKKRLGGLSLSKRGIIGLSRLNQNLFLLEKERRLFYEKYAEVVVDLSRSNPDINSFCYSNAEIKKLLKVFFL